MECRTLTTLECLKELTDFAMRSLEAKSNETSKSCHIKEYLAAGEVLHPRQKSDTPTPDFTLDIVLQSPGSLHQLTDRILKTSKKEYYIIDEIGVIGMIGGTLGLFIGISFLNIITWIMDLFCNIRGLF